MSSPILGKPTFGAGRAFAIGNYTNPTPIRALTPQSQSIDIKRKTESLFGENMLAEAVGAGEMEVTGKVEYAKSVARILGDIMFGDGSTTGYSQESDGEAHTVPASTPYTFTAANYTTGTFTDLGAVKITPTGNTQMICVAAGSEVVGVSYSVSTAGVYKFAAGDANSNIAVSYLAPVSTGGESITLANQLQGGTGGFTAVHVLPWNTPSGSQQDTFTFYNCIASSTSISAKKSGYGTQSLDYMAAVNASGQLGIATFALVS